MPNNGSLVRIYHPNLTALQTNRRIICSLPYDPISLGQPRSHPQLLQLHHHSLGHLLLVAEDLLSSFHLLHLEDLLHVEEALFTNSYMRLSQALMMDWQHIGSTPGKVLFKVLFFALFGGKTHFLVLLLVL